MQRCSDVGIAGGQLAQPCQLQEAGVDDRALVDVAEAAVAEVVGLRRVGVAVDRLADEVPRPVGAGRGHRPPLDVALVVVGGGEVQIGTRGVAGRRGQLARGH